MRKYIATPGAEVIGSAMTNLFTSMNADEFSSIVNAVLRSYGIAHIEPDQWYPHQLSLDIFKQIEDQRTNSMTNLVALGMAYVDTATFPPEINSIYSALMALSLTYHLNIRNVPNYEGYEVKQISDRHIQINDFNPFPHDTVYGFIWGIARRFKGNQQSVPVVTRHYFNEGDPNSDGALYDVKW